MLHPGPGLSLRHQLQLDVLLGCGGKRGQLTGSLHRVFYLNCAAGNPQSCHNAKMSGTPWRGAARLGVRELGRGLEYAEVLIRSHLCPLTMGPPGCREIDRVGGATSFRLGDQVFAKAGANMEKGASCG